MGLGIKICGPIGGVQCWRDLIPFVYFRFSSLIHHKSKLLVITPDIKSKLTEIMEEIE